MKHLRTLLNVLITLMTLIFMNAAEPSRASSDRELILERWPVENRVILGFGVNSGGSPKFHHGIDIEAVVGETVVSPSAGIVAFSGFTPAGGGTVSIQTPSGYKVTLLQLENICVAKGDQVIAGTIIGTVGSEGDKSSSIPHVHLGLIDPKGVYLDPLLFLPALNKPQPPVENASVNNFELASVPTEKYPEQYASPPEPVQVPDARNSIIEQVAVSNHVSTKDKVGVHMSTKAESASVLNNNNSLLPSLPSHYSNNSQASIEVSFLKDPKNTTDNISEESQPNMLLHFIPSPYASNPTVQLNKVSFGIQPSKAFNYAVPDELSVLNGIDSEKAENNKKMGFYRKESVTSFFSNSDIAELQRIALKSTFLKDIQVSNSNTSDVFDFQEEGLVGNPESKGNAFMNIIVLYTLLFFASVHFLKATPLKIPALNH